MDKVCAVLGEGFKSSTDKITIARCNVKKVKVNNLYSLPTIKLYPAHSKFLPVEYIPDDYSRTEGYVRFIQEEGSHGVQWKPIESVA